MKDGGKASGPAFGVLVLVQYLRLAVAAKAVAYRVFTTLPETIDAPILCYGAFRSATGANSI